MSAKHLTCFQLLLNIAVGRYAAWQAEAAAEAEELAGLRQRLSDLLSRDHEAAAAQAVRFMKVLAGMHCATCSQDMHLHQQLFLCVGGCQGSCGAGAGRRARSTAEVV